MVRSPALEEAVGLWHQGDLEGAVAASRRLLQEQSSDVELLVFHAGLLLHLRRYAEARDVLAAALVQGPEHASLLSNLSIAYRHCNEPELAVLAAERALQCAPESLAAWNALLLARMAAGQDSRARSELLQALKLHPEAPSLRHLQIQLDRSLEPVASAGTEQLSRGLIIEARRLAGSGAFGSAEAAYRQALAIQADNPYAHAGLGELLLLMGKPEAAVPHLQAALRGRPSDARAAHLLAVATGQPPPVASTEYVRHLFDGMAETFDGHLRDHLAYRVPEAMSAHLQELAGPDLGEVLDLGCGTGLVGECLAARSQAIDGVDLSPEMLHRARAKNCYRQLHLAEIGQFLSAARQSWQTITAADVFIYHGQLDQLFQQIQRVLAPRGQFCFSVEATSGSGFDVDMASGRYRHSRDYLDTTLKTAGLADIRYFDATIRQEAGLPIAGWIILARSSA